MVGHTVSNSLTGNCDKHAHARVVSSRRITPACRDCNLQTRCESQKQKVLRTQSSHETYLLFYLDSFNMKLLTISALIASALSSSAEVAQAPLVHPSSPSGPSKQYARANAIEVFNALHASMRQWDSSLKHNGMSFFLASIPNNTLLYHGTQTDKAVEGMEWLAFEIEHAEVFARTRGPPGGGGGGPGGRRPPVGGPGNGDDGSGPPGDGERGPPPTERSWQQISDMAEGVDGFLHIYKTKKPLTKLLYLDGMSAGKTSMGTLDTQDRIFVNSASMPSKPENGTPPPRKGGPFGDYNRAEAMCALGAEYGVEGIIRMEAGFELILCNFSTGVELVSAFQRPKYGTNEGLNAAQQFEYIRGVSLRYEGITAGRVNVDYSSMVSAFFHPLNLTNPDKRRPELPRLPVDDDEGLAILKADVLKLFSNEMTNENERIDWQGVVDMIVTRYADRLQHMTLNISTQETILSKINFLLSVFLDYKEAKPSIPESIEKCTNHYLRSVSPITQSDHLIYASVQMVSKKICTALFSVRTLLLAAGSEGNEVIDEVKGKLQELIRYLDWSTWKRCGKCEYDEVCFVAIWPWGGVEDHFAPRCTKNGDLGSRWGYWEFKD
jgi:hypothetical protein